MNTNPRKVFLSDTVLVDTDVQGSWAFNIYLKCLSS